MNKVAVFLADGLEEIEGLTVVDVLRRAGVTVDVVSVTDTKKVTGSHDIHIGADKVIGEINFDDYEMLILPGGMPGTTNLEACTALTDAVKAFDAAGKKIGAICAAPGILGRMGLLEGKNACCYPGVDDALKGATVCDVETVTDAHITTGRSMGCAIPFALEIVRVLMGEEKATSLKEEIVYMH